MSRPSAEGFKEQMGIICIWWLPILGSEIFLLPFTASVENVFQIYPKRFNQAIYVIVLEPSIGEIGTENNQPHFFTWWEWNMDILQEEDSLMQFSCFHNLEQLFVYSRLQQFNCPYVLLYLRLSLFLTKHIIYLNSIGDLSCNESVVMFYVKIGSRPSSCLLKLTLKTVSVDPSVVRGFLELLS